MTHEKLKTDYDHFRGSENGNYRYSHGHLNVTSEDNK